jgi:hypothetical protein
VSTRWQRIVPLAAVAVVGLLALALYWLTAAPGLTWLHQGADGGELLAAAVVDGVPHPPGYPLYVILLQGWLTLTGALLPGGDLAWRGNLASGLAAALSAALTVWVAGRLLPEERGRWLWAALAGLAWAVTPLAWTQAVITEVYALHMLWVAWLALAVLVYGRRARYAVLPIGFGMAHHLTFALLLPAAVYALWVQMDGARRWLRIAAAVGAGFALAALLNVRTVLVAGSGPPPVNWGYADQWAGLWWLLSGEAYRGYLFSAPLDTLLNRLAAWASTLTTQYTPVGLALALVGLARWDQQQPWLRTFSLLWLAPVSVYAMGYNTRDSDIYLLPVVWLMALWLAQGLMTTATWLRARFPQMQPVLAALALAGVLALAGGRWAATSAAADHTAQVYLAEVADVLEPAAIVVSYDDQETFALWYGAWADETLAAAAPGLTLINEPLYQFGWYRRLLAERHPELPGIGDSVRAVVAANGALRPIYFTRQPATHPGFVAEPAGPLWRLRPIGSTQ